MSKKTKIKMEMVAFQLHKATEIKPFQTDGEERFVVKNKKGDRFYVILFSDTVEYRRKQTAWNALRKYEYLSGGRTGIMNTVTVFISDDSSFRLKDVYKVLAAAETDGEFSRSAVNTTNYAELCRFRREREFFLRTGKFWTPERAEAEKEARQDAARKARMKKMPPEAEEAIAEETFAKSLAVSAVLETSAASVPATTEPVMEAVAEVVPAVAESDSTSPDEAVETPTFVMVGKKGNEYIQYTFF